MKKGDKVKGTMYESQMNEYGLFGKEMIWTMRDGTEILIKDMKDSHVQNCINMLRRNTQTETRRAWIDIFEDVKLNRRSAKIEKIKNKLNGENDI
jgi:hypothetical protein